jgi:tripeptidyl-peptidase-1
MNFNQLGMMGTSVLYSSGDNGVAGGNGLCLNSQGLSIFISSNFAYFDWVF